MDLRVYYNRKWQAKPATTFGDYIDHHEMSVLHEYEIGSLKNFLTIKGSSEKVYSEVSAQKVSIGW